MKSKPSRPYGDRMALALSRRDFWRFVPPTLLTLLGAGSSQAASRWPDERVAPPFQIHADFSLAPYEDLLAELGALQQDVTRALGLTPSREPVHVYLFARRATYQGYMQRHFPNVPYRRALFIKGRGPGMVFAYVSSEFEIDLRHESTHSILHASLPMTPLWLDEGLAEYFEAPRDRRALDNPHLGSIRWAVRFGFAPKIESLEGLKELNEMGRDEYRNAWAWVHFMMHGPPAARDELRRFLNDIQRHNPPGDLSRRLRLRVPNLDQTFANHILNWQ